MTDKEKDLTYEELAAKTDQLTAVERIRLVEHIMSRLKQDLEAAKPTPRRSLLGALSHLGTGPTDKDIEEIRQEMWQNFPREDIL